MESTGEPLALDEDPAAATAPMSTSGSLFFGHRTDASEDWAKRSQKWGDAASSEERRVGDPVMLRPGLKHLHGLRKNQLATVTFVTSTGSLVLRRERDGKSIDKFFRSSDLQSKLPEVLSLDDLARDGAETGTASGAAFAGAAAPTATATQSLLRGKLKHAVVEVEAVNRLKAPTERWRKHPTFKQAEVLFATGRYEEAARLYAMASVVPSVRGKAECHYARARCLQNLEETADALTAADDATSADPRFWGGWWERGVMLGSIKRWEGAMKCFEKCGRLDHPPERTEELAENLATCKDALMQAGVAATEWEAIYETAFGLQQEKQYEQAVVVYDNACQAIGSRLVSLRGSRSAASSASVSAVLAQKKSASTPEYNRARAYCHCGRSICLDEWGKPALALSAADEAAKADPGFWRAWDNRGVFLFKLGRYWEAVASFEKSAALGAPGERTAVVKRVRACGKLPQVWRGGQYDMGRSNYAKEQLQKTSVRLGFEAADKVLTPLQRRAPANRNMLASGQHDRALGSLSYAVTAEKRMIEEMAQKLIKTEKAERHEKEVITMHGAELDKLFRDFAPDPLSKKKEVLRQHEELQQRQTKMEAEHGVDIRKERQVIVALKADFHRSKEKLIHMEQTHDNDIEHLKKDAQTGEHGDDSYVAMLQKALLRERERSHGWRKGRRSKEYTASQMRSRTFTSMMEAEADVEDHDVEMESNVNFKSAVLTMMWKPERRKDAKLTSVVARALRDKEWRDSLDEEA